MLRIKGGKVHGPAHNINGVIQDICIDNDRLHKRCDDGMIPSVSQRER